MAEVFEDGPLPVRLLSLNHEEQDSPKPLLIAAPHGAHADRFPLVLLQHGFALRNAFYSQLMRHVASHGFIVVAPQMYTFSGPDASNEISQAAALINWMASSTGFSNLLGMSSRPDLSKFAVMGHSRGGKVAFGLTLGLASQPFQLTISALVALDPVDGTSNNQQTKPAILKFEDSYLKLGCPALVIGAGLGCEKKNLFFPACAPERVGHRAFFRDSSSPAFLFRAPHHGHLDFLDDKTSGSLGRLSYHICKNGPSREPLRRTAGGLTVAFLQHALQQKPDAFRELLVNTGRAPVHLYQQSQAL